MNHIVHKHASAGIKAEHHPIVGRHLIEEAIQETLGHAASPPLFAAWDEAYGELANLLFIEAETNLYAQAGVAAGELRDMRVIEVRKESENVSSYILEAADGQAAPAFKPEPYISVSVPFADGYRQLRQYGLSDAPNTHRLRA